MALKKIQLDNFTVFDNLTIEFSPGVNIFVGGNGLGKTHIMKLLYSACQSVKSDVSFPHKVVKVFQPDNASIQRLGSRKNSGGTTTVKIFSDTTNITMKFSTKTKKWDAEVQNESAWEKQNSGLESVFIPAKEILSNAYNLREAVAKGNVEFDDTYLDIIASARVDISSGNDTSKRKKYLDKLQAINFSSLSFFTSTLKPHPADAIYTVRYSHNTRSVRRLCQGSLCQDRFPFQGLPIF